MRHLFMTVVARQRSVQLYPFLHPLNLDCVLIDKWEKHMKHIVIRDTKKNKIDNTIYLIIAQKKKKKIPF